jgi:splicing factor 3A subunit 3
MKCLGLENTKEFFEVTKIQDALDLAKKLKVLRSEGKWKPTEMEEYEDSEGNVMDRKTYEMFAKQLGGYM